MSGKHTPRFGPGVLIPRKVHVQKDLARTVCGQRLYNVKVAAEGEEASCGQCRHILGQAKPVNWKALAEGSRAQLAHVQAQLETERQACAAARLSIIKEVNARIAVEAQLARVTEERDEAQKWSKFHALQAQRLIAERDRLFGEHVRTCDERDAAIRERDEAREAARMGLLQREGLKAALADLAAMTKRAEEAEREAELERGDHRHTLKKFESLVLERDRMHSRASVAERDLADARADVERRNGRDRTLLAVLHTARRHTIGRCDCVDTVVCASEIEGCVMQALDVLAALAPPETPEAPCVCGHWPGNHSPGCCFCGCRKYGPETKEGEAEPYARLEGDADALAGHPRHFAETKEETPAKRCPVCHSVEHERHEVGHP